MTKHPIEVITSVERRRRWSREKKNVGVRPERNWLRFTLKTTGSMVQSSKSKIIIHETRYSNRTQKREFVGV